MVRTRRVDPETHIIGFNTNLAANLYVNEHDLSEPVEGMTFGVAKIHQKSLHAGERHLAGDEVLYLIDGKARLVFTDDPEPDVDLRSGDVVVVPKGLWHRVDILEPCHFVYLTPGHNNEVRPLAVEPGARP
ncbi:MAG: cupin domain-containing protein [Gammaproteobacteria bacterium]|nr:cupin domain-containing protein [Gammaproteobacteria bacterium]NNL49689.1 cupin domain-containing protein [Woeseiaceae bacterium]